MKNEIDDYKVVLLRAQRLSKKMVTPQCWVIWLIFSGIFVAKCPQVDQKKPKIQVISPISPTMSYRIG